jgi:hypothetical protein
MPNITMRLAVAAAILAVAGCATNGRYEEPPHHFSKDARGNRLACYGTEVANEYECVPVVRRHGYADPYYDPFWSARFLYGWPYPYHSHVIVVREPARPRPPPHVKPRPDRGG